MKRLWVFILYFCCGAGIWYIMSDNRNFVTSLIFGGITAIIGTGIYCYQHSKQKARK